MYVGDYDPVNPNTDRYFTMDFSADIPIGDAVWSVTTAVGVAASSLVEDANAAAIGSATSPLIQGNAIIQKLGGTMPGGFQAGVTYTWLVTVQTVNDLEIPHFAYIKCRAVA